MQMDEEVCEEICDALRLWPETMKKPPLRRYSLLHQVIHWGNERMVNREENKEHTYVLICQLYSAFKSASYLFRNWRFSNHQRLRCFLAASAAIASICLSECRGSITRCMCLSPRGAACVGG